MKKYFAKPKHLWRNMKAELDLSNYVTKAELRKSTSVYTSEFAKNVDLTSLKSTVDKATYN